MIDTYISIDVETTGKIPSVHKTLSVGAVPIVSGMVREDLGTSIFIRSIVPDAVRKGMIGMEWDPDTYDWWRSPEQEKPFERLLTNINDFGVSIADAGKALHRYIKSLSGDKKFMVADPATFDSGFIWELLYQSVGMRGIDELGRMRMVDIRTMRMMLFNTEYSTANRDLVPESVTRGCAVTHDAFDDALFQAKQFQFLMERKENKWS